MTVRSFDNLHTGGRLSASDYNRLTAEVERQSGLRVEFPLEKVDTPGGSLIRLVDTPEIFLARLTNIVIGTGVQAGLWLYGFVEQSLDPATGFPVDAKPGRSADPSTPTITSYAVEIDNQQVPGLGGTPATAPVLTAPIASPLPAPYVEMRLKGLVLGSPVYEFALPASDQAWVKITSATSATITLSSGSATGYPAVIDTFNSSTGIWSDGAAVWFVGINNEVPANGIRYQCRPLGADTSGKAIWGCLPVLPPYFSQAGPFYFTLSSSTYTTIASLTLAYGGAYLVTASVSGSIITYSATTFAQIAVNGIAVAPTGWPVFTTPGNEASAITIILPTVNAGDVITVQGALGSYSGGPADGGVVLTAVRIAGTTSPFAASVNGLTGGVNIVPASGGTSGGGGGSGATTGVGTIISTSGTSVTVGLSSPAYAAMNLYLASTNI